MTTDLIKARLKIRNQALKDLVTNWEQGGILVQGMSGSESFKALDQKERGMIIDAFLRICAPDTTAQEYQDRGLSVMDMLGDSVESYQ